eukprot:CAMPEP_0116835252 /NCGR_PEP_ID=MMETSP0418-20121206/7444_1 /TAXON_ID=1158023 /ORGANISM="Astrosyne radiata, Strain 13vi08-1A" /LENGTH=124 /DNA_ID=CAMNT_0004464903 /DNA_START=93 /DNA_END=467 /DNA_ORIENTATION=-
MSNHPQQEDLYYPNLVECRVKITGASASSKPLVRLPLEVTDNHAIPEKYDFAVEKSVMKKKQERSVELKMANGGGTITKEELNRSVLVKMKSVTGAKEDVCVAMLESNGYDLKTSIEAFFQSKT